ncbi:MAG: TolC family protein [Acidobacteriota bacterium]
MKRLWLFILVVGCGMSPASAQPSSGLTVDEAIRRGLESSHRLAEAAARAEMSAAVVDQRRAGQLPQISAQAGYSRTNHVEAFGVLLPDNQLRVIYPDIPDNYRTRLDVQWPIYTGGRLDALERAARAEAAASIDDLAAARSDLRLEIARAYWALVTARESQRVVDESLNRVGAHLQDVRNQLDAGLVPPNDVLTVEAQASRQRLFTIQARTTRENAAADLARLIGDPGAAIEPAAALDPPPPRPEPFEALLDEARRQRSERAALLKRIAASERRHVAAAAGSKPTIAVAGGLDYARPNPRIFPRTEAWRESWDAGVNAVWPLFDGGRSRAEAAEAAAATRGMQARLAEFDSVLTVEIRQRINELAASRAAIEAATDAVRSATEARRVIGERFAAGVAVSTDVLDAQVALLQAGLDRTQAIASARLAEARLDRALGK